MKTIAVKTVKMDGQWVQTYIIKYSDNKVVKRIYNMNGILLDAIPIKNLGNTNNRIS